MGQYTKTDHDDTETALTRRTLLGSASVLAGSTGLAGCLGGDGGDGGDGDDSSNGGDGSDGGDSAEAVTCVDMTSGYDTKDVGERPMFVDFEYPALFDQLEYVEDAVAFRSEKDAEGEAFFEFLLQQKTFESEPDEILDYEEVSETGWSVQRTFNGEEVRFAGEARPETAQVFLNANLPYEVDGERRLFRTQISLVASEETEECAAALREAVEHVVGSLSLNEETTLG